MLFLSFLMYSNFLISTYTHRSLLVSLYPDYRLLFHHFDKFDSYIVNCCVEATIHIADCCLPRCDTRLAGRRASALRRVLLHSWSEQLDLPWPSDVSWHLYQITWCHILEGSSLCSRCCVKCRSQLLKMSVWNTVNYECQASLCCVLPTEVQRPECDSPFLSVLASCCAQGYHPLLAKGLRHGNHLL